MISSFEKFQSFPAPSPDDIDGYGHFLTTQARVAPAEMRFLNTTNDLIHLSKEEEAEYEDKDEDEEGSEADEAAAAATMPPPPLLYLSLGITAAVVAPVLAFVAIPSFLGRMAVVLLVLGGGLAALFRGNLADFGIAPEMTQDVCACVGFYGAVLAVLAGAVA